MSDKFGDWFSPDRDESQKKTKEIFDTFGFSDEMQKQITDLTTPAGPSDTSQGPTEDEIRKSLKAQGMTDEAIDTIVAQATNGQGTGPQGQRSLTPEEQAEKDAIDAERERLREKLKKMKAERESSEDFQKFRDGIDLKGDADAEFFDGYTGEEHVDQSKLSPNNIQSDGYDQRIYEGMKTRSERLQELDDTGIEEAGEEFTPLMEDLFSTYYKGRPKIRPEDEVRKKNRAHRDIVEGILQDPETDTARISTAYDESISAISTISTGEKVLEMLKENPNPNPDEIAQMAKDASRQGRQAAQETEDAAKGWGLDSEDLEQLDPDERLKLLESLRQGRLKYIAELVGRMKNILNASRRNRVIRREDEVHGLTLSGDLERLLPQEVAAIRHPVRKLDFYRRFLEGSLLSYELKNNEKQGRGPIVICVDCSGSMGGGPIDQAIACAIAFVQLARKQKRNAHVMFFNGAVQDQFPFTSGSASEEIPRLLDIASVGVSGGTAFEPPLERAQEVLLDSKFDRGDILFITDGQAGLSDDFLEKYHDNKKKREFGCYAVHIHEKSRYGGSYSANERTLDVLRQFADVAYHADDLFEGAGQLASQMA